MGFRCVNSLSADKKDKPVVYQNNGASSVRLIIAGEVKDGEACMLVP